MTRALIDIPEELHQNLKRRAIDEDISLKGLIVKALREYIEQHPPMQKTLFDQPAEKQKANERRG